MQNMQNLEPVYMVNLSEKSGIYEKVGATSMARNGSSTVIVCFWRHVISGGSDLIVDQVVM